MSHLILFQKHAAGLETFTNKADLQLYQKEKERGVHFFFKKKPITYEYTKLLYTSQTTGPSSSVFLLTDSCSPGPRADECLSQQLLP